MRGRRRSAAMSGAKMVVQTTPEARSLGLRDHVAVYAQVIHELRTELDRRTDNTTQRRPVRSLPTSTT